MEMLAGFFCSKLFVDYVIVGVVICIAAAFLFNVITPKSAGEVMDESNDVIMWCFIACFAVGVVFLWLPILVAVVWFNVFPEKNNQSQKEPLLS